MAEKSKEITVQAVLSKLQTSINVPKSKRNKFAGFNYRNQEDILNATKAILEEAGAYILLSDSLELIGDRYYIKATAELWLAKESISVSAYARESLDVKGMDIAQITGSTSSYARKYALNGLLAIDDSQDPDSTNDGKTKEPDNSTSKTQEDDNKPWLNEKTEVYRKVVKAIIEGERKPADIRNTFRVSKAMMASLEELVK